MAEQNPIVISLMVARAQNGVIGAGGAIPWHLPNDLRYFKQTTMGKPVIMGSKTWASLLRRPLPGRANIVLSRSAAEGDYAGAHIARSLAEALELARQSAPQAEEIFIIGGGDVFRQALPLADRIYITEIDASIDGDVYFKPDLPPEIWHKTRESALSQGAGDSHAYRFALYEKREI